MKATSLNKKKNEVIDQIAAGIIWKWKSLLYFGKKIETTYAKDKKYCKFRDPYHYAGEQRSAILAYVISNIVHLKNPYNFFIMDLTMIIILSWMS